MQEVQDELLERKGMTVDHVIMTSDEPNATWWQEVTDRGWLRVDHSKTEELYGGWCVALALVDRWCFYLTLAISTGILF